MVRLPVRSSCVEKTIQSNDKRWPESAFDEQHPYYDAKSDRSKPRWRLVHVEFRSRFAKQVTLKDLQTHARGEGVLADMQVLKQSRLSVSKVTRAEWDYILGIAGEEEPRRRSGEGVDE